MPSMLLLPNTVLLFPLFKHDWIRKYDLRLDRMHDARCCKAWYLSEMLTAPYRSFVSHPLNVATRSQACSDFKNFHTEESILISRRA